LLQAGHGRGQRPAFPAPLFNEGDEFLDKLGRDAQRERGRMSRRPPDAATSAAAYGSRLKAGMTASLRRGGGARRAPKPDGRRWKGVHHLERLRRMECWARRVCFRQRGDGVNAPLPTLRFRMRSYTSTNKNPAICGGVEVRVSRAQRSQPAPGTTVRSG